MIVADQALGRAVSAVPTYGLSDEWLQPTPLRGRKIVGVLAYRLVLTAISIYKSGAADAQAVGRSPLEESQSRR
jgi:hypothetical protein